MVSMDCSGLPCDDMICINMSKQSFQEETHFFLTRCLDPSSPSVGKKSSFPTPAAAATASQLSTQEDCLQFGKSQEGACWEAKRQKVSVEEEEESRCWMPDTAQFMQKRIKVEGVGIKMVRDLTMDDFLRLVSYLIFVVSFALARFLNPNI